MHMSTHSGDTNTQGGTQTCAGGGMTSLQVSQQCVHHSMVLPLEMLSFTSAMPSASGFSFAALVIPAHSPFFQCLLMVVWEGSILRLFLLLFIILGTSGCLTLSTLCAW